MQNCGTLRYMKIQMCIAPQCTKRQTDRGRLCSMHSARMWRHQTLQSHSESRVQADGRVILSRQAVAIIDIEDIPAVAKYTWHLTSKGYAATRLHDKQGALMYLHRFVMNAAPDIHIDHRNHCRVDCRKKNLRACTNSQNVAHQYKTKRATSSRYKGVTWNAHRKKWQGQIQCNGKRYSQCFELEIDAARFYNEYAQRLYGEFAVLNPC